LSTTTTTHGRPRPGRAGRIARLATVTALAATTLSCATPYVTQLAQVSGNAATYHISTDLSIEACRDSLSNPARESLEGLDTHRIRLVNWNIKKGSLPSWQADYSKLSNGSDLVLIQEAALRIDTINDIQSAPHWSFAPGYRTEGQVTGVLTLSNIKPLTQCSFVTMEPVLRTPKATNITQYGLRDTDQTLVVVNIHAVNFSFGLGAFEEQFSQISRVLENHTGPVVLSGDFNTWRAGRLAIVDQVAADLDLKPLHFDDDQRVRVLGKVIDHIYVRGLDAVMTETRSVETSDHNPMSVELKM
jgi:endonuclease/exonuclease/phosphatase (EEP) superfamily protein YafD